MRDNDREDIILHMPTIAKMVRGKKVIIEIGSASGNGSTRAIDSGVATGATWISVDIENQIPPDNLPQFADWKMIEGDSRSPETLKKVKEILGDQKADFIFIDTIHEKDFLAKELDVWKDLATPQTVWAFHDTWISGNYNPMTDAIKEFAEKFPIWKFVDISMECNGFGALVPAEMSLDNLYE